MASGRSEGKRSGSKVAARASALLALLLAAALIAPALAGCGDGAVHFYIGQANELLADINTTAGELKKLWSSDVSDLGKSQETLAAYRKALGRAQARLDRNDAPKSCLELDSLLRRAVDRGREYADIFSPFADYGEYIGPVAGTMNEIVASVQTIRQTGNQPAGLAGLKDKCDRLETEVRTIVPPGVFQGIHDEILAFVHDVAITLGNAASGSAPRRQVIPPDERETGADERSARLEDEERRDSERTAGQLEGLPQYWQSFNGKLSALWEVAREVTGLRGKNYEVENAIGQALEEMKKFKS